MANQVLYGFTNLLDLKNKRVTDVGIDIVNNAINDTLVEQNRLMDLLIDFFATRTTDYSARFTSSTNARLQPLDENGRALPIKAAGYYDIAFPIQMGGTAWGYDYVTGMKMTVGDVMNATDTMIIADRNWVIDHIFAALLTNVNWTFKDKLKGSLTIKGLANGDTDTYRVTGASQPTTAQHYFAQADAIDDAHNPFPTIYETLSKRPENGGDVVSLVPTNLVSDVEALADFHEPSDPNIRQGANSDVLVGRLPENTPGRIIGYVNKVWVAEAMTLPDNYIISTTTEGGKPLAMREDEEEILRGFKQVADRNDHPFYERQYLRRAGFGAWNRVGATVTRIGNGTYAIPTGYSSPMA